MSENEWVDLSDSMEKNDGYVKRDAQAIKDRPGVLLDTIGWEGRGGREGGGRRGEGLNDRKGVGRG